MIIAGTFHQGGEKVFREVRGPSKVIVVELADERYARLVLRVDGPRAAVALVEGALA